MERDRILQQQLQEEAERMEQQRQKEVSDRIYRRKCVNDLNFNVKFTQDIAKQKIERAFEVPNEPDPSDTNAILLLFILPNGVRLERRFRRTDLLKVSAFTIEKARERLNFTLNCLYFSCRICIRTFFVIHNHPIDLQLQQIFRNEHSKPKSPRSKSTRLV